MELIVQQKGFGINFEYSFFDGGGNLVFKAKANRTVIPLPRKIFVYNSSKQEICSLRQDNIFKFVLANIPFMGIILRRDCPYNFYEGSVSNGFLQQNYFVGGGHIYGNVSNAPYSIYGHSGNDYSIFRDDLQVASILRSELRLGDGDKYKLIFDSRIDTKLAVILTVLVDITWHTYDTSYTSLSWERSYQLGGKKRDEEWIPKD